MTSVRTYIGMVVIYYWLRKWYKTVQDKSILLAPIVILVCLLLLLRSTSFDSHANHAKYSGSLSLKNVITRQDACHILVKIRPDQLAGLDCSQTIFVKNNKFEIELINYLRNNNRPVLDYNSQSLVSSWWLYLHAKQLHTTLTNTSILSDIHLIKQELKINSSNWKLSRLSEMSSFEKFQTICAEANNSTNDWVDVYQSLKPLIDKDGTVFIKFKTPAESTVDPKAIQKVDKIVEDNLITGLIIHSTM